MAKLISAWFNQSIIRKIGGLSSVLLAFIFVVIVYSIFKLMEISREIHEVVQVDLPLTELASEIEVLQLQQHLQLDQVRVLASEKNSSQREKALTKTQLMVDFDEQFKQMSQRIQATEQLIRSATASGLIAEKVDEHSSLLFELEAMHRLQSSFHQQANLMLSSLFSGTAQIEWRLLEKHIAQLDQKTIDLLHQIEILTKEIATHAEKHQQEFILVNTALGICAFLIGIYFTLYIINSLRQRVGHIQAQIGTFQQSLEPSPATRAARQGDELAELAADVDLALATYTKELRNREALEDQLIQLATTDKLTGAFNRHKWEEHLSIEIGYGKRGADIALLLLDVDHFKKINDSYGHDTGDKVLQILVRALSSELRQQDPLFRLGGEEFAVLFRDKSKHQAQLEAEKLRLALAQITDEHIPSFTASFGVGQYIQGEPASDFVKRVDQALYKAKHSGRNRVEVI